MKLGWATPVAWVLVFLLVVALVMLFQNPGQRMELPPRSYSQLIGMGQNLKSAIIRGEDLEGRDETGARFIVRLPHDAALADRLAKAGTDVIIGVPPADTGWLTTLLANGLPLVLYAFLWFYPLMRIARALEALIAGGAIAPAGVKTTAPPSE